MLWYLIHKDEMDETEEKKGNYCEIYYSLWKKEGAACDVDEMGASESSEMKREWKSMKKRGKNV